MSDKSNKPRITLSKLITRTGDDGSTGLVDGSRVPKDHLRISAFGTIDELSAFVGLALDLANSLNLEGIAEKLSIVQNELYDLGSELSNPAGKVADCRITEAQLLRLESWCKDITDRLPALTSFVLAGGTELNSRLHICRTVCRRAERAIVSLHRSEQVAENLIKYINRASDLFFALSREASLQTRSKERLWQPGSTQ